MKTRNERFHRKDKVIAICRGTSGGKSLLTLVSALNDGGVKLVEVTLIKEILNV